MVSTRSEGGNSPCRRKALGAFGRQVTLRSQESKAATRPGGRRLPVYSRNVTRL